MSAIIVLFFFYFASLHISVAGMEALQWLVLLPTLYFAIRKKKFLLPSKIILTALIGLLVTAALSFVINIGDPSRFLDYIGEFRWMLTYFLWLQFFNLFYDHINFNRLMLVGQIVLIIAGFYSFYQFFAAHDFFRPKVVFHYLYDGSPYFRPNSFFGLPTTYAYASAMFFCLSLSFWLREKKRETALVTSLRRLYLVMSPFNIFLTFTRAAWLAFIASTLTIIRIINRTVFIRVALVFVLFIVAFYSSFSSFQHRVDSMFDTQYIGNANRLYLWRANLDIFKQNPVFGLGFEENRKKIDLYLQPYNRPDIMRNHPHNTYINFLAGLGLVGFTFFMLMIVYNLRISWVGIQEAQSPLQKNLFIGILGAQLVLLLGGLTECTFEDSELTHQYILYTALVEYLTVAYLNKPIKGSKLLADA